MVIRTKNKRGGQQGNQNARKHGFYSSTRSPDEMCRLQDIIAQEFIDQETAVFRVKLQSLVQRSPDRRTLQEASRLIVKWSVKKYRKAIGREVLYFGRLKVLRFSERIHRSKCS